MASRKLEDAEPTLAAAFVAIKAKFDATFPAYELRPICTLREDAEQIEAFTSGHSQIDPRIPEQRKRARHLAGEDGKSSAIDAGIFRKNPKGMPASYVDDLLEAGKFDPVLHTSLYWNYGLLVQRAGFRWGGDWNGNGLPVGPDPAESFCDEPHMEIPLGAEAH